MHLDVVALRDCHLVAAGILPAVKGGILPPGPALEISSVVTRRASIPLGETPDFMRLKSVESLSLDQQPRHLTAQNLPGGIETNQPLGWLPRKCMPLPGDALRLVQAVNSICSRKRQDNLGLVACESRHYHEIRPGHSWR
jgi:hypothetical protein